MNRETLQLTANIIASDTEELYEVAREKGINMPHPALGIFKSVLAEIEEPNGNGVRLGEKATKEAISTLVGTQINRNHSVRKDPQSLEFIVTPQILGHAIDAKINDENQVEVICIFFKSVYQFEWEEAKYLFAKNKLTMSFEISADVESQEKLDDGTKRLNDYYFTGAGLLFGVKPACKNARVFEMASQKFQEQILRERQCLIFANNQKTQKSILEVLKLMADEVKKIDNVQAETELVNEETAKVEAVKTEETAKVEEPVKAEEAVKTEETAKVEEPVKAEEAVKTEETATSTPEVSSEESVKAEESTETVTDSLSIVQQQVISTPDSTMVHTVVQEADKTTYPSGNSQTHIITQETVEQWIWEQVQAMKAEHEKEISSLKEQLVAKEKEVEEVKASLEEVKNQKIEASKEEIVMSTGHKYIEACEESKSVLVKYLKNKKQ